MRWLANTRIEEVISVVRNSVPRWARISKSTKATSHVQCTGCGPTRESSYLMTNSISSMLRDFPETTLTRDWRNAWLSWCGIRWQEIGSRCISWVPTVTPKNARAPFCGKTKVSAWWWNVAATNRSPLFARYWSVSVVFWDLGFLLFFGQF